MLIFNRFQPTNVDGNGTENFEAKYEDSTTPNIHSTLSYEGAGYFGISDLEFGHPFKSLDQ